MRGGWAIEREPVDLTVGSLKEHVKIKSCRKVVGKLYRLLEVFRIVMSEEGSSS